jgi:hypothetical protein
MKSTAALILLACCGGQKVQDATPTARATATVTLTPTASATATTSASADVTAGPSPQETHTGQGEAGDFGTMGLVNQGGSGDAGVPTAPWGRETKPPPVASHGANTPTIRQGATSVVGQLPPEVIQRIVRQNFGRFKLCYSEGLRKDGHLAGKVSVKFVIDATGAVSSVQREATTTMPDATVVDCIVRGFGNLSFPQPEGGIVTVIYPINFAPGD